MPNAQGGGKMLKVRRNVLQGVQGIDELILEDKPFERRSYERTTLSTEKRSLQGPRQSDYSGGETSVTRGKVRKRWACSLD